MFLKPFLAFIITIYSLLLLELLTTWSPSLPLHRLVFFQAFLLQLDYNLIHTKRNRCKKKQQRHEAPTQGTRKYLCFENQWKMFFSSHLTRTAWNTNTCSIHHWTRSCSTEEEFTGNRSRTRKIALLWEERKKEPCGVKCPSPPYRGSAQSRTKEETCGEQTTVHELAGWLSSKVKWYWRGFPLWRLSEMSTVPDGKNIFQRSRQQTALSTIKNTTITLHYGYFYWSQSRHSSSVSIQLQINRDLDKDGTTGDRPRNSPVIILSMTLPIIE